MSTEMEPQSPEEDFDPSRRRLCPDGACVGVIGDDGICSECGRTEAQAAAGDAPPPFQAGVDASAGPGAPDAADGASGVSIGFDPTTRRLCDDGACVGVVGDDGVCRVCGRRSE
jgi:hypothetical protein